MTDSGTMTPPRHATLPTIRRVGWLAIGLSLLSFAIFEVVKHDLGPWPILAFILAPDLAFVAGIGQPHAHGQLPRRAVPVYNALHQPLIALATIAITVVAALSPFWFVVALIWLTHIAIDRAAGYNLRTADGWIRG